MGKPRGGKEATKAARLRVGWERSISLAQVARKAWQLKRSNGDEESRERARRALSESLGALRGIPMKIGQTLASASSEDPLRELVTGVTPLPLDEIEALVSAELGEARQQIVSLDPPLRAASLGQVHPATHRDGRKLAVKVQYPGMERAVSTELGLLRWMPSVGPMARYSFDLQAYRRVLRDNFERELDYACEAQLQTRFRESNRVKGLLVPRVIPELSTRSLLSQEFLTGRPLAEAESWDKRTRLRLGQILLQAFVQGLFVSGLLHGDPHEGNYAFTQEGEVVLYDFGCVLELSATRSRALLSLVLRLRSGETLKVSEVFDHWVALGFHADRLEWIAEELEELSRILFEPMLCSGSFDLAEWRLKERTEQLLGARKWWFRSAGPADLFLILRVVQGLCSLLRRLDVHLPWWGIVLSMVEPEHMARAEEFTPPHQGRQALEGHEHAPRTLRIRMQGASEPIDLAFPAREALQLSRLVPPHVVSPKELERLAEVERKLQRHGLESGPLLSGSTSAGSYSIWLE